MSSNAVAGGGGHGAASGESLEDKLRRVGDAVTMVRDSPSNRFKSPYPDQYTTWQEEQEGWRRSATLFDQSHHMTDVYFRGPDVRRLLEETGTNSFAGFGVDRAKHLVVCTEAGWMVGTAVLFGLEEEQVSLVGPAGAANWLQFRAETDRYDVEVVRDERTRDRSGEQRLTFRFEIEGPAARSIVEKVNGGPIDDVPFFRMTRFAIAGRPVRALTHTMAGLPGAETMGYEIFGPAADGPACWDALVEAGEEFELRRGGTYAYYTGSLESGYAAQPLPAVYSGDDLRAYREWLPGDGYEGTISVGGSFASPDIEDYYVTPWDFGYGHLVRFDHDFIGRDALERTASAPHRRKVWLRWDDDDVARVLASSLFDGVHRAKYLEPPLARYARVMMDDVLVDDERVGVSTFNGYTVNFGGWCSIGFLDEGSSVHGSRVEIVWGEENGGTAKRNVERHEQTRIRATVHTTPPFTPTTTS